MIKSRFPLSALALLLAAQTHAAGVPVEATQVETGFFQPSMIITGKLEAQEHANLTPRVTGYLVKQNFADGSSVTKGDVLFEIDPTPYQLALDSATAVLQQAEANLEQAKLNFNRTRDLQGSGGATKANLDDATAQLSVATAGVASAKAGMNKAEDDLSHTKVRAPYSGTIGKARFSQGDMVSPATGALIDIAQLHPLNASFSLGYDDFNKFQIDEAGKVNVSLVKENIDGQLTFIDNKINATSGTIEIAATFDNADNALRPNQITRIQLTSADKTKGVWIPHTAVIQDLMMQFIYVVNDEGLAERREITVDVREGKNVFISQGLESGEMVITDGLIRVRPNAPVAIQ